MKIFTATLRDTFQAAKQIYHTNKDSLKKRWNEHHDRYKRDAEYRIASIQIATYAACITLPAALAISMSIKEGEPWYSVWGPPNGSEKIEFTTPEDGHQRSPEF